MSKRVAGGHLPAVRSFMAVAAVALGAAGAGHALAGPLGGEVKFTLAGGALPNPGANEVIKGDHQTGAAGSGLSIGDTVHNGAPNGAGDTSHLTVQVQAGGRPGSNVILGARAEAVVNVNDPSGPVRQDSFSGAILATATVNDHITALGSAAEAGRIVTLHTILTLDNSSINFDAEDVQPGGHGPWSARNESTLSLFGTVHDDGASDGSAITILGSGASGQTNDGNTFASLDVTHTEVGVFPEPNVHGVTRVELDTQLTVGQAADFALEMLLLTNSSIFDGNGSNNPLAALEQSFALEGGAGASFFTDQNGTRLYDLSLQSDAGFDFLRVQAQETGGGGAAGVPEPATWALMISGLGMAGASLRQRQRKRQTV
jgi:hypothetical protein